MGSLLDVCSRTRAANLRRAKILLLKEKLHQSVGDELVKERMAKAGAVAVGSTSDGFGDHMKAEFNRWSAVREAAKIEQQ